MKSPKLLAKEVSLLLRSIPSWVTAFFVASLVAMNLLANKSIGGLPSWLALDAGFIFSWVAFALMDITVKRFSARAANILSFVAISINLFVVFMFFLASLMPGEWSTSYNENGQSVAELNSAVNQIFSGSWYVVFGSTMAIVISTVFNNFLNATIGRALKKDNFISFAFRSYVSTFLGQFVDNLAFAFIVSVHFFGWTVTQSVFCAITGAVAELLMEVIFSPFTYKAVRSWEEQNVGQEYLNFIKENK